MKYLSSYFEKKNIVTIVVQGIALCLGLSILYYWDVQNRDKIFSFSFISAFIILIVNGILFIIYKLNPKTKISINTFENNLISTMSINRIPVMVRITCAGIPTGLIDTFFNFIKAKDFWDWSFYLYVQGDEEYLKKKQVEEAIKLYLGTVDTCTLQVHKSNKEQKLINKIYFGYIEAKQTEYNNIKPTNLNDDNIVLNTYYEYSFNMKSMSYCNFKYIVNNDSKIKELYKIDIESLKSFEGKTNSLVIDSVRTVNREEIEKLWS